MVMREIWDKFTVRFLKFARGDLKNFKTNEVNLSQISRNKHVIPG